MNEKDQIKTDGKFNFMCALSMNFRGIKLTLQINLFHVLLMNGNGERESIAASITKHLKRLRMRFRAF